MFIQSVIHTCRLFVFHLSVHPSLHIPLNTCHPTQRHDVVTEHLPTGQLCTVASSSLYEALYRDTAHISNKAFQPASQSCRSSSQYTLHSRLARATAVSCQAFPCQSLTSCTQLVYKSASYIAVAQNPQAVCCKVVHLPHTRE